MDIFLLVLGQNVKRLGSQCDVIPITEPGSSSSRENAIGGAYARSSKIVR
jgi:hypothetical protein